jgi:hypothetical protein
LLANKPAKREGFMKVPLTTRLDPPLRQQLRVYVAVTGRKVEDVVSAALMGYLPSMSEMVQNGGEPCEELLAEQLGVA